MSTSRISPLLRQRVAEAARYRCGYCLTSQHIIGPLLEIDHYIPESRGGTSDEKIYGLPARCAIATSLTASVLLIQKQE